MDKINKAETKLRRNDAPSDYYLGESGERYFLFQRGSGDATGRIEARKFQKYISPADSVLDFGCGGGYLLKSLTCGKRIGVEVNPAALKECEVNQILAVDDISQIQQDSIDVVISNHSMEHVLHPFESLESIFRVLRYEGTLLLCTPIDDWRKYKEYDPKDTNHHLYTWSPQNIGNLLSEAGFEVADIKIFTHAWPPKVVHLDRLLSVWLFDILCKGWSIINKQRQIFVIAKKVKR